MPAQIAEYEGMDMSTLIQTAADMLDELGEIVEDLSQRIYMRPFELAGELRKRLGLPPPPDAARPEGGT